jgi:hypothetical protein
MLSACGIVRGADESLIETTARALGITYKEFGIRISEGRFFE